MTTLARRGRMAARRASALYCATDGRGAPLLLIHGLGASGDMFRPLLPELTARYQVIVPDLRGHGRSRCLPGPDTIARMAADVENLLDLLGISSCFVLGYAAGGAIAQQLAHDYPSRMRGLVLACSYARSARTLREQIEGRLRPKLFRLLGTRRLGAILSLTASLHGTPAEASAFVCEMLGANSGSRIAPVARSVLGFDSRPWLHTLRCPTLIVAGEADGTTPPEHARELAEHISGARLKLIPGAGHWLVKTHSDALLDTLLPWLAEQEATP